MKISYKNGKYNGTLTTNGKKYQATDCASFEDCTAQLIEEALKWHTQY